MIYMFFFKYRKKEKKAFYFCFYIYTIFNFFIIESNRDRAVRTQFVILIPTALLFKCIFLLLDSFTFTFFFYFSLFFLLISFHFLSFLACLVKSRDEHLYHS